MHDGLGAELLDRLLKHLCEVVPGAVGVAVSVLMTEEPPAVVTGFGPAERIDQLQWRLAEGPLLDARRTERPVVTADLTTDSRWPHLRQSLGDEDVAGVIVVPGSWDDAGPMLISVYLRGEPSADELAQVLRLEPLLATALGFVEFCSGEVMRADQMLQMMQYRRVIEQAKGLVIGALGCDSNQAFDTLTRASQHFNVRLRDVAIALVEHVGSAPAEQPEDPSAIADPSPRSRAVAQQVWTAIVHRQIVPPGSRT